MPGGRQPMCPEGYQRVETKQRRGRAQDRQVGPLALRLDAQVSRAGKGGLDPPAGDEEPRTASGSRSDRCKKRLRLALAGRIATRIQRISPEAGRLVPDRDAGNILQLADLAAVPFGQACGSRGFRDRSAGAEFGPAFAFSAGRPIGPAGVGRASTGWHPDAVV